MTLLLRPAYAKFSLTSSQKHSSWNTGLTEFFSHLMTVPSESCSGNAYGESGTLIHLYQDRGPCMRVFNKCPRWLLCSGDLQMIVLTAIIEARIKCRLSNWLSLEEIGMASQRDFWSVPWRMSGGLPGWEEVERWSQKRDLNKSLSPWLPHLWNKGV